jgi:DNA primase
VHPIIIPYFQDGRIVYLQGRTIGSPPDGASKYQFLSGVPRSIFNIDSIKKLRPNTDVYITEGAFDCMTLVKNGMMAVSLGSAKVFKKEWIKYFKKYKIWVSFDNDTAGIKGADDLVEELTEAGILAEKRDWSKGFKDINEYFERK